MRNGCVLTCIHSETPSKSQRTQILRALYDISPEVEDATAAHPIKNDEEEQWLIFYVQLKGLHRLYPSEHDVLRRLYDRTTAFGGRTAVGAASTCFEAYAAAYCAIQEGRDIVQTPDGIPSGFFSRLPVDLLPEFDGLGSRLRDLGIQTIDDFAHLNAAAVRRRFGKRGQLLHRMSRGESHRALQPSAIPCRRYVRKEFDAPVKQLYRLEEIFKTLMRPLLQELADERHLIETLRISLRSDLDDAPATIHLRPASATRRLSMLAELFLLHAQAELHASHDTSKTRFEHLARGIYAIEIQATELRPEGLVQRNLFASDSQGREENFDVELTRLARRLGPNTIGIPTLTSHDLPDKAYEFIPLRSADHLQTSTHRHDHENARLSTQLRALLRDLATCDEAETSSANTVLRLVDPPHSLRIRNNSILLDTPRRVENLLGPFHMHGEWWKASYRRTYFRMQVRGPIELLVFRDDAERTQQAQSSSHQNPWKLAGVFD